MTGGISECNESMLVSSVFVIGVVPRSFTPSRVMNDSRRTGDEAEVLRECTHWVLRCRLYKAELYIGKLRNGTS